MATAIINVRVEVRWWLKYLYLPGFCAVNWLMVYCLGVNDWADPERVMATVKRGVRFYIVDEPDDCNNDSA